MAEAPRKLHHRVAVESFPAFLFPSASDCENDQDPCPAHKGVVGHAAAEPPLLSEPETGSYSAVVLRVPLDPEPRHPLRKQLRGPSLAIRNRAIAFSLPHDAWLSELQGFIQILIRRITATTEDGHQPALRSDYLPTLRTIGGLALGSSQHVTFRAVSFLMSWLCCMSPFRPCSHIPLSHVPWLWKVSRPWHALQGRSISVTE